MAFRFRSADRLSRRAEFVRVLRQGSAVREGSLLVRAAWNGLDRMRLGLRVPRVYGSAVERNRAKRVLREAFRLWRGEAGSVRGMDLVLTPKRGTAPELEAWTRDLVRGVERAAAKLGRMT